MPYTPYIFTEYQYKDGKIHYSSSEFDGLGNMFGLGREEGILGSPDEIPFEKMEIENLLIAAKEIEKITGVLSLLPD